MSLYNSQVSNYAYLDRTEIEVYKSLDPAVRIIILKALCDIRVEVLLMLIYLYITSFYLKWVNLERLCIFMPYLPELTAILFCA